MMMMIVIIMMMSNIPTTAHYHHDDHRHQNDDVDDEVNGMIASFLKISQQLVSEIIEAGKRLFSGKQLTQFFF